MQFVLMGLKLLLIKDIGERVWINLLYINAIIKMHA